MRERERDRVKETEREKVRKKGWVTKRVMQERLSEQEGEETECLC